MLDRDTRSVFRHEKRFHALLASLLLDLARRELDDNALKSFAFRGVSPAICGEELHLVLRRTGDALELGAFAADGRQVMSASAT